MAYKLEIKGKYPLTLESANKMIFMEKFFLKNCETKQLQFYNKRRQTYSILMSNLFVYYWTRKKMNKSTIS